MRTSKSELADVARRYWETYLPARAATVGDDPDAFFLQLAGEVRDDAISGMANYQAPATSSATALTAAYRSAFEAAVDAAMHDLVYLTPEPGTENLRQAGTEMLGWDDEDEPPGPSHPGG